ncbi:MAG: ABC transporter ATP-binding protein [Anaerolineales bacterium]|nr:ABC transporter ATP-binding protein [Anaerolineales bacterium]
MSKILLEAKNLSRAYGDFQALKPTNLALHAGELVALTGPNGSGKTTLLLCLSGLLRPTTGEVRVSGFDLYSDEPQARQHLAYVPDVPVFYQELTAWEHLLFVGKAHHVSNNFEIQAEKLLREFGLWEARNLFPHAFSRGMRLKLGVILALVRSYYVLLLDEPSSALDVDSSAHLCEKLQTLSTSGIAILLTTHDPHFAQQLDAHPWQIRDGSLQTN